MDKQELQAVLEAVRDALAAIGQDADIATIRKGFNAITGQEMPGVEPLDCHGEVVAAGSAPAEWIAPQGVDSCRAILYLHGGAYCIGSIDSHRRMIARLATAADARALALDYHLAPEHPFPTAVNDAVAAYRWMLEQGCTPDKMAIAGDSAGGGLTVATLVALRDAGVPLPAAACAMSPWADLEVTGPSATANAATDPTVQVEGLRKMGVAYLGGAPADTPLAAPIYADLTGLPPLLIQVGAVEVLYDDSIRLAQNAEAAGVNVTLEPWDGMAHVFQGYADILEQARTAIDGIGAFFKKHWN